MSVYFTRSNNNEVSPAPKSYRREDKQSLLALNSYKYLKHAETTIKKSFQQESEFDNRSSMVIEELTVDEKMNEMAVSELSRIASPRTMSMRQSKQGLA